MLNLKDLGGTRSFFLRIFVTILAIGVWFWTQSLIGARALPSAGIGDGLHNLTAGLNAYLQQAPAAGNALLIVSSALIDALGLFLLGSWIFTGNARPFLGLLLLLGLRQVMQALCALPAPPNMIWHYPGFPSLFVTYNVANDYFFSGHTGIAVWRDRTGALPAHLADDSRGDRGGVRDRGRAGPARPLHHGRVYRNRRGPVGGASQ